MVYTMMFILFGYLSGSLMFARILLPLFHKEEELADCKDRNPGATNAFLCGGTLCGVLTLIGDVAKGAVPVYLFLTLRPEAGSGAALPFVMAAPVLGHAYPVFFRFLGGKGIATSFGCLLGLAMDSRPLLLLAASFLFFSLVVRIQPHFYRTMIAFLTALVAIAAVVRSTVITFGFLLICGVVCLKLHQSKEEREAVKVGFLWKR